MIEKLRQTAKNGKVFRIIQEVPAWTLYVIEFGKIQLDRDNYPVMVWYPAYEPKNRVFTDYKEACDHFDTFLAANNA